MPAASRIRKFETVEIGEPLDIRRLESSTKLVVSKFGDLVEAWSLQIWKFGSLKVWEFENRNVWKFESFRNFEIWKFRHLKVFESEGLEA